MLASIIASNGLMHFILARKDGPDYYVMNPDGGKDEKHNDLFTNYINSLNPKTIGGVNYIFTGVAVWIAPSSSPWYF
jgi:hypothetical protein